LGVFFKAKTQANNQVAVSGLQIQSSVYGKVIPIVYGTTRISPNLIWYGDFVATAHQSGGGGGGGKGGPGGGGGGKGGGGSTTYTYSTAVALGLCEGPIQDIYRIFIDKNINYTENLGMSEFLGGYSQSPWGYLSTNHSAQALNYRGTAYVGAANYQLGTSPQLPNHNFEVYGVNSQFAPAFPDAFPDLAISDLLTNVHYGLGYSGVWDFTIYRNYTMANGLWISVALQEQATAASILDSIAKNTNSEFVWSSGTLYLIPYGDQSITAHGYTYTAPSSPQYSLDDSDFVQTNNDLGPVVMTRKRVSDQINSIKLECLDRNNFYNPAVIEAKDQVSIDLYGLRQETRQAHMFCDTTAARLSVQLQLQRESVRNTYSFTLDQRYILLDPMDIIAITDSGLGLNQQWVRILEITENSDGNLEFLCEEYLGGTGSAPVYDFEANTGFNVDYNSSPGNVNTPVIFDAPVQLSSGGVLETWIAASGGSNWGGADVWISNDGNTYKLAGRITGGARQGLLTATFSSGSDPDTTNICSVNLTQSRGQLFSGTQNDADIGATLCYVDGELIAYQTATLTSTYNYDLNTYIRRGMYGTTISSHSSGTKFARLDGGIFKYTYDKSQIGQIFYIKFLSFNIYGGAQQSLSDVSPVTHTIVGPPAPPNVTGFTVTQNGGATVFRWNAVDDFALKGYDILYGPQGQGINTATFLTEAGSGTEMTNAAVPTGNWTFYIRARDITDRFSPVPATYDATIVTQSTIIFQEAQEPDWLGTKSNLVEHYTGVLIPVGTLNSDDYVQISAPSSPTLGETPGGSLTTDTYYVKITYVNAYGSETDPSAEDSFTVADDNLLVVTSPAPSSGATGWNVYVSTSAGTETLQNSTPYAIGSDWTMPTSGLVTGAALPTSNSTGWEVFDIFVPDPVTTASYTTNTIDTSFNDTLRVYSSIAGSMGPGESGQIDSLFEIDTWLTGEVDPATYVQWSVGFVTIRYIKARFTLTITPGSVPYITDFTPTGDRDPKIQDVVGVVIAPGGTTVTFPLPYHFPPYVQAINAAASALLVTVTSITETTFVCHMFNTSGSDVGGTINYRCTGE
jgi:hypothetical protein